MTLPQAGATGEMQVAQQQGTNVLNANADSNLMALQKYFGRYNMNPQAYMGTAAGVIEQSRRNSLADFNSALREQQVREDMYNAHMDMMWQYYKQQMLNRKLQTWGAGLGALGQVGAGIIGGIQSGRQPNAMGALGGIFQGL